MLCSAVRALADLLVSSCFHQSIELYFFLHPVLISLHVTLADIFTDDEWVFSHVEPTRRTGNQTLLLLKIERCTKLFAQLVAVRSLVQDLDVLKPEKL